MKKNHSWSGLVVLCALVSLGSDCDGGVQVGGGELQAISVTPLAIHVQSSGGGWGPSTHVGLQRVRVEVDWADNTMIPESTKIAFWRPGGAEDQEPASVDPSDPSILFVDVPTSEELGICEAICYMWSITYSGPPDENGESDNGAFLGQTDKVMPTSKTVNGQLEQALCAAPQC